MRFFPGRGSGCRPGPGLSIVLLTLACDGGGEPRPPIERSPAVSDPTGDSGDQGSGSDTGDGTDPVGPGSWDDPILRVGSLDVVLTGVELTDAALLGNTLILAGQQQAGDGGMWKYDLSDRDAPVLTGKSRVWHAQRVCISSETLAWGTDRGGRVVPYDLSGPDPLPGAGISGGGWDHGLDCTETRIAWGEGADGGVIGSLDGRQLRDPVRFDVEAIDVSRRASGVVSSDALGGRSDRHAGRDVDRTSATAGTSLVGGTLAVARGAGGVHLIDPGSERRSRLVLWRGHARLGGGRRPPSSRRGRNCSCSTSRIRAARGSCHEPAESRSCRWWATGRRAFVADWNSPSGCHCVRRQRPRCAPRCAMPAGSGRAVVQRRSEPLVGNAIRGNGGPESGCARRGGSLAAARGPRQRSGHRDRRPRRARGPTRPGRARWSGGGCRPLVSSRATRRGRPGPCGLAGAGRSWECSRMAVRCVPHRFRCGGVPAGCAHGRGGAAGRIVRLWAYDGPASRARGWAEQYDIAEPVLADGDRSMRQDYFVPNGDGAFAANPRHYVIDRQGRLVFLSTTVAPGDLMDVIETALGEPQEDGADRASVSR